MEEIKKISKLLGAREAMISSLFSGKEHLARKIIKKNSFKINFLLKGILPEERNYQNVLSFLEKKHRSIIFTFNSLLRKELRKDKIDLINFILKEKKYPKGNFLKIEKIKEILFLEPPGKVMRYFSCQKPEQLFEKVDIWEILASLRFVQGMDWLNKKFLPHYSLLRESDFEKREIKIIKLSEKWTSLADEFIKKKFHNISHLKEFGLIFIIPQKKKISQEKFFCDLALLFHYLQEIEFFDKIFMLLKRNRDNWQSDFIRTLKGIEPEGREKDFATGDWLIVSQYLAKRDKKDWRLYFPHLNSESCHWKKAGQDLVNLAKRIGLKKENLSFWQETNWVGKFFPDKRQKKEVLISFNFIDISLSLANKKKSFYSYHFHEAFWNKIFEEIFPQKNLERELQKNWLKGKVV